MICSRERKWLITVLLSTMFMLHRTAPAQQKEPGPIVGIRFGGMLGKTSAQEDKMGYQGKAFFRHHLMTRVQGELEAGFGEIRGDAYRTQLIPLDYRLLFWLNSSERINPYLYAGAGSLYYELKQVPRTIRPDVPRNGWAPFVPLGVGAHIVVSDVAAFDVAGGLNYVLYDGLDGIKTGKNDAVFGITLGVVLIGKQDDDRDKDGLKNNEERRLRTDPDNPDTDGDGLTDGEEVMKYKTDPLNPDTDGDGLTDGEEVMKYKTDPLNPDTDGDGLTDGQEVHTYKTDPLNPDTDGDGLTDGEEVMRYHTDPLKADTDNGSVPDGVEVRRGTNPLDPSDDVPKEVFKAEVGKPIVLDGVVFEFGKATLTPESERVLNIAFNTLNENPGIMVEIHGHTDNIGRPSFNLGLSSRRAESVKQFLVNKGISPERIATRGFGAVRPIASNATEQGRQQNRRIEFVRVK